MKKYLLSVVIPTKNRQFYVQHALLQILTNTSDNVQIVIQDNSDNDSLKTKIENLNEQRIVYNYTSDNLSFVDNFEKALGYASGEYLVLIGDDDGILPSIEKITEWAIQNNFDAVTSKIIITYYWPHSGAKNYRCSEESGYIRINNFDNSIKEIDSRANLIKVIKNACQFYHSSGIPKLYHGIVKKEVIKNIIKENGKVFSGLSPDIYSSFMISIYSNKVAYTEIPFTIDGNCPKSGAGAQAQGKHTGNLKNAPHFNGHDNYHWNKRVPFVYSIQTIWADSGLAALEDAKRYDLIDLFSTEKITAYTFLNNPSIRKNTLKCYMDITNKSKSLAYLNILLSLMNGPLTNYISRIIKRIVGKGQVGYIINDVEDISIATNKINEYLKTKEKQNEHF